MNDSVYYKLKSIEMDLAYYAREIRARGAASLFTDESKKNTIRSLIVSIGRSTTALHNALGDPVIGEFPKEDDDKTLP